MANHVPMLIATYQRKIICIWVNCKLYSCHGDLRITHWGIIFVEYEPPYMHLLSRHTLSWLCLYSLSPPNMTLSNIHRHIREVGCLSPLHHYQNTSTYNQGSRRNLSDAQVSDKKIVACVVGKYKGYKIVRKS